MVLRAGLCSLVLVAVAGGQTVLRLGNKPADGAGDYRAAVLSLALAGDGTPAEQRRDARQFLDNVLSHPNSSFRSEALAWVERNRMAMAQVRVATARPHCAFQRSPQGVSEFEDLRDGIVALALAWLVELGEQVTRGASDEAAAALRVALGVVDHLEHEVAAASLVPGLERLAFITAAAQLARSDLTSGTRAALVQVLQDERQRQTAAQRLRSMQPDLVVSARRVAGDLPVAAAAEALLAGLEAKRPAELVAVLDEPVWDRGLREWRARAEAGARERRDAAAAAVLHVLPEPGAWAVGRVLAEHRLLRVLRDHGVDRARR